jgi:predicted nucleic acid-binding protein
MRFADTSFWIAYRFCRDDHHAESVALWRDDSQPLLTTNHVVGETCHDEAIGFLDVVERSERVTIAHVGEDLEREARTWLRRHDERAYSFVDATSFAVMRHNRIHEALAFGGDFAAAGFSEVRP